MFTNPAFACLHHEIPLLQVVLRPFHFIHRLNLLFNRTNLLDLVLNRHFHLRCLAHQAFHRLLCIILYLYLCLGCHSLQLRFSLIEMNLKKLRHSSPHLRFRFLPLAFSKQQNYFTKAVSLSFHFSLFFRLDSTSSIQVICFH